MRSASSRRLAAVALTAAASVVALAGPAFAHVTVNPGSAQQGGYTAVDFRVPNENDAAGTVKLEINLPLDHPLASVRTMPLPGWTAAVEKSKLDKPIKVHGSDVNEAVSKITWTADAGTKIAPGQFQEFKVSLGPLPTDTDSLVFKALQTYDNGDVVRWIDESKDGQPEPAKPAPVLKLTKAAAGGDGHGDSHGVSASPAAGAHGDSSDHAEASDGDKKSSDSTARVLGVVGIVVGVIGTGVGIAGLRRKSGGSAS
ncbi:YcnI family protein [Streptomyces rubellomurinus]|uniref:Membrane protein n=2 Tax=Streptomyces TaxID=1883 RepID=A0A0F2T5T4_STRR3|nr:YcnI family protein [Streptomyces rubellomurinus]KJS54316.1 membrane protein [Streptomyces rubellomurinus subsp. indigoferus]KJS58548.1 membrane protein [Streptomyces rubellomurinus]